MCSPVHGAVLVDDVNLVKELMRNGMDINAKNSQRETPLLLAVQLGHLDMAYSLVQFKASLNACNSEGLSPLHIAAMKDFSEFATFLMKSGARVNDPDLKNNLPLHFAVKNNNLILVKSLLKAGSKGNTLNKMFESPTHIAVRMFHIEILKELVLQDCDVNVCEPFGNVTPLHVAVNLYQDKQFQQVAEVLLKGKCDINSRAFSTLETPLYRAVDMCKTEVAEYLLVQGANSNLACPFDVTSFQKACCRLNTHLVKLLLHCGINWKKEKWIRPNGDGNIGMVTTCKEINEMIQVWRGNVTSLQNLSRIKVRDILNGNLATKLKDVNFPERLKDFLMLSDIRLYC